VSSANAADATATIMIEPSAARAMRVREILLSIVMLSQEANA
jgi:hypothetical protein